MRAVGVGEAVWNRMLLEAAPMAVWEARDFLW